METTKNSFKLMMEEDELHHPPPPEIEQSVLGSLQILQMMAQAMELYIPKALEMFVLTLGGTIKEIDATGSPEGSLGESSRDEEPKSNDLTQKDDR
ncbi:MAG: hypothetical protein Kow0027_15970 [Saprospiraceae bacterium]